MKVVSVAMIAKLAGGTDVAVGGGSCSADDQAKINAVGGGDADGHFPAINKDCARASLNFFKGIDKDKFNDCLTGALRISPGCSTCYWGSAEYGFEKCKMACMSSWCSSSCLECSRQGATNANRCAGFETFSVPVPCDAVELTLKTEKASLDKNLREGSATDVTVGGGSCSADDQAKINAAGGGDDNGHFPAINSNCARLSLNFFKGIDRDKFNGCLIGAIGISPGCSTCYWGSAEYGFEKCKMACISSWCSSSCLECTKQGAANANRCAGFDTTSVPVACDAVESTLKTKKASLNENLPEGSIFDEIKKLACALLKNGSTEEAMSAEVCSLIHDKWSFVPEADCEDAVKLVWEKGEAKMCTSSVIV